MSTALEVWGGIECTVRRVGEEWDDQLERSGHARRLDDLDRLADLGLRRLRYPVLWERTATREEGQWDWRWSDVRLRRLRELGLPPIVGLLHHGSGPRWTSLADPEFPRRLARYARAVAERYPWVDAYTPINEPLTTARFAGLYGHWHPHMHDDRAFACLLLRQCRGIVLAMREIRRVRPDALLIQTEDLGAVHATPPLVYQAEFENHRRWLTVDILAGRVDRDHPLWSYLMFCGVPEGELAEAQDDCCPPDVIGVNHYLTSERFLDHRLDRYPAAEHGGNSRELYADVAAVRSDECVRAGPGGLLTAAWDRYRIPLAVSEVHLGCTREHQLRWLAEVWRAALSCRASGVDVRAVTVWSMFGAFDWASLLTQLDDRYEPGAFDVRSPSPRPTAIAAMTRALARQGSYDHPVLDGCGWWVRQRSRPARPTRQLAITGSRPQLIAALRRACEERGLAYSVVALDAVTELRPWAVIHAGRRPSTTIASLCARGGTSFLAFSSDHVFDGTAGRPYVESDPCSPTTVEGRCTADAERAVTLAHPRALILRTGPLFSDGSPPPVAGDVLTSPTYTPDLVTVCLDLLIDGVNGIWHLANPAAEWRSTDARRSYVLASERGALMPPLDDAVMRSREAAEMAPEPLAPYVRT